MTDTASAMGQAFDDAKSDDYFYLPPEAFSNPDFQRGLKLLVSPNGMSTQFVITHDVDPATPKGISTVDAELKAAREAIKNTPLADAKISLGGTAATYRDIQMGAKWDLLISAVGAITLCRISDFGCSGCVKVERRSSPVALPSVATPGPTWTAVEAMSLPRFATKWPAPPAIFPNSPPPPLRFGAAVPPR